MSHFSPGYSLASHSTPIPTHVRLRREAEELRTALEARVSKINKVPSLPSQIVIPLPESRYPVNLYKFAPPAANTDVQEASASPQALAGLRTVPLEALRHHLPANATITSVSPHQIALAVNAGSRHPTPSPAYFALTGPSSSPLAHHVNPGPPSFLSSTPPPPPRFPIASNFTQGGPNQTGFPHNTLPNPTTLPAVPPRGFATSPAPPPPFPPNQGPNGPLAAYYSSPSPSPPLVQPSGIFAAPSGAFAQPHAPSPQDGQLVLRSSSHSPSYPSSKAAAQNAAHTPPFPPSYPHTQTPSNPSREVAISSADSVIAALVGPLPHTTEGMAEDVRDRAVWDLLAARQAVLRAAFGGATARAAAEVTAAHVAASAARQEVHLIEDAPDVQAVVAEPSDLVMDEVRGGWTGQTVSGFGEFDERSKRKAAGPLFAHPSMRPVGTPDETTAAGALLVDGLRASALSASASHHRSANARMDDVLARLRPTHAKEMEAAQGGILSQLFGPVDPSTAAAVAASMAPAVAALTASAYHPLSPTERTLPRGDRERLLAAIEQEISMPLPSPSLGTRRNPVAAAAEARARVIAAQGLVAKGDARVAVGRAAHALDEDEACGDETHTAHSDIGKYLASKAAELSDAANARDTAIRSHAEVLLARAMIAEQAGEVNPMLDAETHVVRDALRQLPLLSELSDAIGISPSELSALVARALTTDARERDIRSGIEQQQALAAAAELAGSDSDMLGIDGVPRSGAWRVPTLRAAMFGGDKNLANPAEIAQLKAQAFSHEQTIVHLTSQLADAQAALAVLAVSGGGAAGTSPSLRNRSEALSQQLEAGLVHVLRVLKAAAPVPSVRLGELAVDVGRMLQERGLTGDTTDDIQMDDNAPTGQVTLVFTDVQSSTKLWDTFGEEFTSSLDLHDAFLRESMRAHGGYEVKTEGDSFMVAFSTPKDAAHWMVDVQVGLMRLNWPDAVLEATSAGVDEIVDGQIIWRGLRVRMGAHTGVPICQRNPLTKRMDYFGPSVNQAARVQSQAFGGQLFISSGFANELMTSEYGDTLSPTTNRLPLAFSHSIRRHGWHRLKGIKEPVEILEIVPDMLRGRNFPLLLDRQAADRATAKEAIDNLLASNPGLIPTYHKCAKILQGACRLMAAKNELRRRRARLALSLILQRSSRAFLSRRKASHRFHVREARQRAAIQKEQLAGATALFNSIHRMRDRAGLRAPAAIAIQRFVRSAVSTVIVARKKRRILLQRSATIVQAFIRTKRIATEVRERGRALSKFRNLRLLQAFMRSAVAAKFVFRRFTARNPQAALAARKQWLAKRKSAAPAAAKPSGTGTSKAPSAKSPSVSSSKPASEAAMSDSGGEAAQPGSTTVDSVRDRVAAARARRNLGPTTAASPKATAQTNQLDQLADRRAKNAERLEKLKKQKEDTETKREPSVVIDAPSPAVPQPLDPKVSRQMAKDKLTATIARRKMASDSAVLDESGTSEASPTAAPAERAPLRSMPLSKPDEQKSDAGSSEQGEAEAVLTRAERLKLLQARRRKA